MNGFKTGARVSITAVWLAGCSVLAQAHENPPASAEPQEARVSRILGLKVESTDGEPLGKVSNFILDMRSSQVRYAIIASGGFPSLGSQRKIAPARAMSLRTVKKDTVSMSLTKARWKDAPGFKPREFTALNRSERRRQIDEFYGQPSPTTLPAKKTRRPGAEAAPTATGRETDDNGRDASATGKLVLTSDIIGKGVINRQQEVTGKVSDLLIDVDGNRMAFVIISVDRPLKPGQSFAVPLRSLSLTGGDKVLIDANRTLFERARPFDPKSWQAAGSSDVPGIYRYEKYKADDTGRNARDRNGNRLTPLNQSETNGDRELTSRIRRAVMNHQGLSFTARNIQIITIQGKVTLRGPVLTERERNEIARVAESIAGAPNVDNELEAEQ